MIGTSLSPTALPKASSLTNALTAPSPLLVTLAEFAMIRQALERELGAVAERLRANDRVRVDAYHLRDSLSGGAPRAGDASFRWTPLTARRPIGIECARACLANPRLSPLESARDAITHLVRHAKDQRRPGSLAEWVGGLAVGGRAVVQAEAVLWTTQLMTALDWDGLRRPVIGRDSSVVLPSSSRVLLRGRIEVQTWASPPGSDGDGSVGPVAPDQVVLLSMMPGRPGRTARMELGLSALTSALDNRQGAIPARVVGWWPQCGRALVVPVDVALLNQTCQAVVATVRSSCPTKLEHRRSAAATPADRVRSVAEQVTSTRVPKRALSPAERAAS
jgi:hypothetical protein